MPSVPTQDGMFWRPAKSSARSPGDTNHPVDHAASTFEEVRPIEREQVRAAWAALQDFYPHAMDDSLCKYLASDAPLPPADDECPEILDELGFLQRFQIERVLGQGGFATVFLARDRRLGRQVAVKVFDLAFVTSEQFESQFFVEARTMAELQHSSLVAIYDAGADGAMWYLVMEYVEGPSLAEWISTAGSRLPLVTAAQIVAQLSDAVQYAHARGRLHCDIKPSNILLEPSAAHAVFPYQAKLSDFGLARRLEESENLASEKLVGGTPRYMAPEQATGRGQDLTVATDVYGLGCVLYELVTGHPPFSEMASEEWWNQVGKEQIRTRCHRSDVPADLAAICDKCLQPSPVARYATARELQIDLQRYLAGQPVVARPLGYIRRMGRWMRRRPLIAVLVFSLLISLCGGAFAVSVLYQRERLQRQVAEAKRKVALQAVDDMYGTFPEEFLFYAPYMELHYRQFVEKALAIYEKEAREHPEDERGLYGLQVALHRSANSLGRLGRHLEAIDHRRRCLTVINTLLKTAPSNKEYRFARFHNLLCLANERADLGFVEDALQQAYNAEREIESLKRDYPDNFDVCESAISTAISVGRIHGCGGQFDLQAAYLQKAEDCARQLEVTFGVTTKASLTIARVLIARAELLAGDALRLNDRLQLMQECQNRLQGLLDNGEQRWTVRDLLVCVYLRRADIFIKQRRFPAAEQALDSALARQEELVREFPLTFLFLRQMAEIQWRSAVVQMEQGDEVMAHEHIRNARKNVQAALSHSQELVPSLGERALLQTAPEECILESLRRLPPFADEPTISRKQTRTESDETASLTKGRKGKKKPQSQRSDRNLSKRPELAIEFMSLVSGWFSSRRLLATGDSAFGGRNLLRKRPANVD